MNSRSLVNSFLQEELARLSSHDAFKVRLGHLERARVLLAYLEQTVSDYREASGAFMANLEKQSAFGEQAGAAPRPVTPEELRVMEEGAALAVVLHLRIEAFYIFAKILLDKLAQTIEGYFGQGQAASLATHSKLKKNIAKFANQKQLTPIPDSLVAMIEEAESRIGDYRDYYVTHEASPKLMKATGFNTVTGETWIIPARLYPAAETAVAPLPSSESPPSLMEWLDGYVAAVLAYLAANRGHAPAQPSAAAPG